MDKKYKERKFQMGVTAFVLAIMFALLDANSVLIVPDNVTYMLGAIAGTWLVTEGYIDSVKIKKKK